MAVRDEQHSFCALLRSVHLTQCPWIAADRCGRLVQVHAGKGGFQDGVVYNRFERTVVTPRVFEQEGTKIILMLDPDKYTVEFMRVNEAAC